MNDKRFNRWLVLEEAGRDKHRNVLWLCICDCGTVRLVTGNSLRTGKSKSCGCLRDELSTERVGSKNPHWKGGRYVNDAGYVVVYDPDHPRAMSNGYVREHIVIAERAFGGELPIKAQVHHYGHVSDNSKLVVCEDQGYHRLLHIRSRALKECGDAGKRKCKFCQKYDFTDNLHIQHSRLGHGWNVYHDSCRLDYERELRVRRSNAA